MKQPTRRARSSSSSSRFASHVESDSAVPSATVRAPGRGRVRRRARTGAGSQPPAFPARLAEPMEPPPVRRATDNELMAQIQAESHDAFAELYDRYCDRAFRVARAVAIDATRAEDAVQEAFAAVWNSRATYRARHATPAPWLLTIVRHRAIDANRRQAPFDEHRASDAGLARRRSSDDVAGEAVDHADARDIRALLARLPDTQREVIILAFYGQLTHTEIAAELDVPPGTVKGRMRLGFERLRSELEQTGHSPR